MEYLLFLGLIIFVIWVISRFLKKKPITPDAVIVDEKKQYSYTAKESVMTDAEVRLFTRLQTITKDKYLIFPQLHLSALVNHTSKGQSWRGALSHINSKSVDYVLCDPKTMRPVYAVELDDWSHDKDDRIERDLEVKRILGQAGIPLVRLRDHKSLSDEELIKKFSDARDNM